MKPVPPKIATATKPDTKLSNGWLYLIAIGVLVVLAILAAGAYIFGMLMLAFSMDSAAGKDVPGWIDWWVLVVFPIGLGLAVVIPPIAIALRMPFRRVLLLSAFAMAIPLLLFIGAFVGILVALS